MVANRNGNCFWTRTSGWNAEQGQVATLIISRTGGKRWLADVLIPRFAPSTCCAEVHVAAAVLSFMRPLADVEVSCDVDDELINPYSCGTATP